MAERRSNRQRKPVVHFDETVPQPDRPAKPRKPRTKVTKAPEPYHDPASAESSNNGIIQGDPVQLLCKQTQGLNLQSNPTEIRSSKAANSAAEDLKAKKKVKAEEIAGLKML